MFLCSLWMPLLQTCRLLECQFSKSTDFDSFPSKGWPVFLFSLETLAVAGSSKMDWIGLLKINLMNVKFVLLGCLFFLVWQHGASHLVVSTVKAWDHWYPRGKEYIHHQDLSFEGHFPLEGTRTPWGDDWLQGRTGQRTWMNSRNMWTQVKRAWELAWRTSHWPNWG